MIRVTSKGDFAKTREFVHRVLNHSVYSDLERYGAEGVEALASSTPTDTGHTAASWHYRIIRDHKSLRIEWYNTNTVMGNTSVAVLIQYGHGTGTGGFVQGRDFINPAMRPIFDQIANDVWKKVTA